MLVKGGPGDKYRIITQVTTNKIYNNIYITIDINNEDYDSQVTIIVSLDSMVRY